MKFEEFITKEIVSKFDRLTISQMSVGCILSFLSSSSSSLSDDVVKEFKIVYDLYLDYLSKEILK